MPIERIQRDRRHGQPYRREVCPRPTTEQTHRREPYDHPQKRHFVRCPPHTCRPCASRALTEAMATAMPLSAPTRHVCSVTYRLIRHACSHPRQPNPSSVALWFPPPELFPFLVFARLIEGLPRETHQSATSS